MSRLQNFDPRLLLLAQDVKLLIMDVDGVLTNGQLVYNAFGEEMKVFNALDGQGLVFLRDAGIELAVISGRDSPMLKRRAAELKIAHLSLGVHQKLPAAEALLAKLNLKWSEVAAIGDDWPDAPLLKRAALAAAPANAHVEIQALAHKYCKATGGAGAVREVCDLILAARGKYRELWEGLLQ
jgi:3-deoxy-D-manno-octulosonate 8-phosphate phosphatase (KDO 8-P phosphatase)